MTSFVAVEAGTVRLGNVTVLLNERRRWSLEDVILQIASSAWARLRLSCGVLFDQAEKGVIGVNSDKPKQVKQDEMERNQDPR